MKGFTKVLRVKLFRQLYLPSYRSFYAFVRIISDKLLILLKWKSEFGASAGYGKKGCRPGNLWRQYIPYFKLIISLYCLTVINIYQTIITPPQNRNGLSDICLSKQ